MNGGSAAGGDPRAGAGPEGAGPGRPPSGTDHSGGPPRQASLARLAEFGIEPKRALGQNFLVDDNILGVILERLQAGPDDVVLEVGAGLGILTRALAGVAGHVHTVEIDRRLQEPLLRTLGPLAARVTVHFGDVMEVDPGAYLPPPTLCASNLPYSVAAPFLAEALPRLPGVRRYCVMVQREIAERIAAAPGGKIYGALSVWVQLHARVVEVRPLSRTIFSPRPRVDSSLLTLERQIADPLVAEEPRLIRRVVEGAFAQRRKLLANSLAAAAGIGKSEVAAALAASSIPPGARAEQLIPAAFVEIARALQGRYPAARSAADRDDAG